MKKILPYLMLLMIVAVPARATTTYRYSDSVTTVRGDAVGGASVAVYMAGTTTKATLYLYSSSTAGTKTNPTHTDGYGRFSFYLLPGTYDFTISGTNITTYTIEDVRIWSDSGYVIANILDYGAIPDDGIDDRAAIQSAITAAGGFGVVQVPEGVFVLSDSLKITYSYVTLEGFGAGSVLSCPSGSRDFALKVSAPYATIRNLNFLSSVSTEPTQPNECISLLSGAVGTEISGCRFSGFNVQIRGAAGCDDVRIVNNQFGDVVGTNSGYGYGIQLNGVHGGVVSGNTSTQTTIAGRHHIYLSAGCRDITVTGNTLIGGTSAMIQLYATMAQDKMTGCVVANNILNGLGTGGGTGGAIHVLVNVEGAEIIGNTIYDVDGHGIEIEADGTNASNCRNNTIIGNSITNPDLIGVYIKGARGAVIVGNVVSGAGSGSASTAISLNTNGSSLPDSAMISSNKVYGTTHTYALRVEGSGSVIGQNVLSVGTSGVQVIGAAASRAFSLRYGATAPTDTTGMRGQLMWFDPTGGDTLKVYTGTPDWRWQALH